MSMTKIDKVFCDLVINNQDNFAIDDDERRKLYTLAYNDGLIAFRSALMEQTDDKNANENT